MKKFLIHIAIMALTIICLLFAFDRLYTYTYSHSVPRNKFQYILTMAPNNIDYVFLGSSRVANHIVTPEVTELTRKSAINLGIDGIVLEDNLLQLKILLSKHVKIEKVFLQVDYLYETKNVSPIGSAPVLPFLSNPVISDHLEQKLPNFTAVNYIPFYRYISADYAIGFREFFFAATGRKSKNEFDQGFVPKTGQLPLRPFELPKTIRKTNKTLDEIKLLCKKNNVELMLFCAPMCSQTTNLAYIDMLKLKFPELYDYSRAMSDDYFYDCLHLNEKGAIVFTKMLLEDCCLHK